VQIESKLRHLDWCEWMETISAPNKSEKALRHASESHFCICRCFFTITRNKAKGARGSRERRGVDVLSIATRRSVYIALKFKYNSGGDVIKTNSLFNSSQLLCVRPESFFRVIKRCYGIDPFSPLYTHAFIFGEARRVKCWLLIFRVNRLRRI